MGRSESASDRRPVLELAGVEPVEDADAASVVGGQVPVVTYAAVEVVGEPPTSSSMPLQLAIAAALLGKAPFISASTPMDATLLTQPPWLPKYPSALLESCTELCRVGFGRVGRRRDGTNTHGTNCEGQRSPKTQCRHFISPFH